MKYILVTGGVMSGIGKGIVTSSIGALLKACSTNGKTKGEYLKITAIKIDPYHNVDAGLFSPYEHGEVFVLDDGTEVDLDLGNYERFLDIKLNANNNITTGKIDLKLMENERMGVYQGKTVQTIPHKTNAIQDWIRETAQQSNADICMIELGGTIGDIESKPFAMALRQLKRSVGPKNFVICHVGPIFTWGNSQEIKTKPLQRSVIDMKSEGLLPDILVCRTQSIRISDDIKSKISSFTDVEPHNMICLPDLKSVYMVPKDLETQNIQSAISKCFDFTIGNCDLKKWEEIAEIAVESTNVDIALVGKYTIMQDCYTSVIKSLEHACYSIKSKPKIHFIESTKLEESDQNEAWKSLKSCRCLIVPGGFGQRGTEGMIKAIQWARLNRVPFLGVCLGFQLAVIEYARNVLKIEGANSAEFADLAEPIIIEMLDYKDPERKLGGTMRLGLKATKFVVEESILKTLYGNKTEVMERHRHRYEVNPSMIERLDKAGLKFVGMNGDETRMEILELDRTVHPYFVGVQFHPEYLSRPFKPSAPYVGLITAARKVVLWPPGFQPFKSK